MKLDLRNLESDGKISLPLEPDAIDASQLQLNGNGTLELTYHNRETSLSGTAYVKAALLLECARCLQAFPFEVETEFPVEAKIGSPSDDDDENTVYFTEKEPVVDLSGLITEELLVNIPMMPVCNEECKGLCPGCGADLNQKECTCAPKDTNPAWDALKKLKRE